MPENMIEVIREDAIAEVDEFIAGHPKGHFMQTSLWAKQKPDWQHIAIAKRGGDGAIVGAMSILIRKVPKLPYTLMYCCRGPVCDMDDEQTILDLLAAAKHLARTMKSYAVKIDPDVAKTENGTLMEKCLATCGFVPVDGGDNFESAQPRFVFRLDVGGKTEEEVMAAFESKTRYNVRLAARKGVVCRNVEGGELEKGLDDFSALMDETGRRDGFVPRNRRYFANMLENLGEHARLYMCYLPDGTPVSGAVAIWYGDKVWYLYGASSSEHREYMPNYLMQWEMIRWAVERGCRVYDFRGVSGDLSPDNPLYGLYRFKKGFGGDFVEFIGEYDYVLSKALRKAVDVGKKMMMKRAMKKRGLK